MDTILQGMDGIICYLDDILISGKTEAEHLDNLHKVLQKFKEHGIKAKKSKIKCKTSVQYPGHVIDADGLPSYRCHTQGHCGCSDTQRCF